VSPANGGVKGKRKSKKDKLREAAARKEAGDAPAPTRKSFSPAPEHLGSNTPV